MVQVKDIFAYVLEVAPCVVMTSERSGKSCQLKVGQFPYCVGYIRSLPHKYQSVPFLYSAVSEPCLWRFDPAGSV